MILKRIAVCPGRRKGTPVCANVLTVSFTDAAKCEDCTASVGDECMSMENWWNDTDRRGRSTGIEMSATALHCPPMILLGLAGE